MKKLKLDLDELEVESFETTEQDEPKGEGTVRAYHTGCPECETKLTQGSCLCTFGGC